MILDLTDTAQASTTGAFFRYLCSLCPSIGWGILAWKMDRLFRLTDYPANLERQLCARIVEASTLPSATLVVRITTVTWREPPTIDKIVNAHLCTSSNAQR